MLSRGSASGLTVNGLGTFLCLRLLPCNVHVASGGDAASDGADSLYTVALVDDGPASYGTHQKLAPRRSTHIVWLCVGVILNSARTSWYIYYSAEAPYYDVKAPCPRVSCQQCSYQQHIFV